MVEKSTTTLQEIKFPENVTAASLATWSIASMRRDVGLAYENELANEFPTVTTTIILDHLLASLNPGSVSKKEASEVQRVILQGVRAIDHEQSKITTIPLSFMSTFSRTLLASERASMVSWYHTPLYDQK